MDAFRNAAGEEVAAPRRQPGGARDEALLALGRELKNSGYRFTTVTPATHRRVLARRATSPPGLEDVFGWSRSFGPDELPARHLQLLAEAGELAASGLLLRSRVRFSTLADQIFVHSAYPTEEPDVVFFGPDTYRFARLIRQALPQDPGPLRLLDIGAGSGAGGLHAWSLRPEAWSAVVLSDTNPRALRFSRINARLNGVANVEIVESDLFARLAGPFDVIMANPPYLVDPHKRLYRHGGGALGSQLGLDLVSQALDHLAPSGRLILYSGSAIVDGVDAFRHALAPLLHRPDLHCRYEEIDPDVFGEELEQWPYDRADRIAVIGLTVDRLA